ncbi:MAG: ribonuclease activity regulator RraA [Rickettsiales bacterium]
MLDDTRETLKRISTATITLQLLKRGIRNTFMRGVAPLAAMDERLVGEAVTLRFIPMREDISTPAILADKNNAQRVAIDTIPEGAVLVIDARGVSDCAALGDILAERIKQRGGAGVVTDGGVRDAAAVAAVGVPIFAAGPAAPASLTAHTPVDRDLPIGCGGVAVIPGDIIVGDGDGVVVIPQALADEVARDGLQQEGIEAYIKLQVEKGRSTIGLYPPDDAIRAEYAEWLAAGKPT